MYSLRFVQEKKHMNKTRCIQNVFSCLKKTCFSINYGVNLSTFCKDTIVAAFS